MTAPAPLPRPDPLAELPIVILYPHSRCNCRCLMCDIWRDTAKRELGAAEVTRWVGEWRRLGVRQVVLSGGEALLHSDLWTICEGLREAGILITLLSTGLLLARDAARVAHYCAEVIVSLDGPEEVHDRIRNLPRAYRKLAAGVAALRAQAPATAPVPSSAPAPAPAPAPASASGPPASGPSVSGPSAAAAGALPITGRCTVQRLNFRHLRATAAAARELGFDRLSFLAADVSTDAFNRPLPWAPGRVAEVALAAAELPELAAELDALERERPEDFASGFLLESPDKLRRRLYDYYAALCGQGDFPANRCNAPWVSTVIEADGTVRPCFFQPPLGNLRQAESLAAVLDSPPARAWRRGLDVATDPICRKCVCTLAWDAPAGMPAGRPASAPAEAPLNAAESRL
jgi:MoaA/NifB/PqqE/SkfB family radical SAM enzyme